MLKDIFFKSDTSMTWLIPSSHILWEVKFDKTYMKSVTSTWRKLKATKKPQGVAIEYFIWVSIDNILKLLKN